MPDDAPEASIASKIEAAIKTKALTLDEICASVFGRNCNDRNRSTVRLHLHRLDARGALDKTPRKYKMKA